MTKYDLGRKEAVPKARDQVYGEAKARHPTRCSGRARNWTPRGGMLQSPRTPPESDTCPQARSCRTSLASPRYPGPPSAARGPVFVWFSKLAALWHAGNRQVARIPQLGALGHSDLIHKSTGQTSPTCKDLTHRFRGSAKIEILYSRAYTILGMVVLVAGWLAALVAGYSASAIFQSLTTGSSSAPRMRPTGWRKIDRRWAGMWPPTMTSASTVTSAPTSVRRFTSRSEWTNTGS